MALLLGLKSPAWFFLMPTGNGSGKRLTSEEYIEAQEMWMSGDYTLEDIAEKVGVSRTALAKRFKRDGLTKGSAKKTVDEAVSEQVNKVISNTTFVHEHVEQAFTLRKQTLQLSAMIHTYMRRILSETVQVGKPLSSREGDLKALDTMSKINGMNLKTLNENFDFTAADADDEDTLPEFTIKVMDSDDIDEIRKAQDEEEIAILGGAVDVFPDLEVEGDQAEPEQD